MSNKLHRLLIHCQQCGKASNDPTFGGSWRPDPKRKIIYCEDCMFEILNEALLKECEKEDNVSIDRETGVITERPLQSNKYFSERW